MNIPTNPIITSRRGKIARLPLPVREELNTRLLNGEEAKTVLLWLNALPAVQEILAAKFKNKPVAECNLSEWRKGGYMDWFLFHQMAPETRVSQVMESDQVQDGPGVCGDTQAAGGRGRPAGRAQATAPAAIRHQPPGSRRQHGCKQPILS